MANVNVTYQEMEDAATKLTTAQQEIETKLTELKTQVNTLVNGGYVTDSSSKRFEASYEEFTNGAKTTISGLNGMSDYLKAAASAFRDADTQLAGEARLIRQLRKEWAMSVGLKINTSEFCALGGELGYLQLAFNGAESDIEKYIFGHSELANEMSEFVSSWDDRRIEMGRNIESLATVATAVSDTFDSVEVELGKSLGGENDHAN